MKRYRITLELDKNDVYLLLAVCELRVNWDHDTIIKKIYTVEDIEERESVGFLEELR